MKKLFAFCLAAMMAVSLSACAAQDTPDTSSASTSSTEETSSQPEETSSEADSSSEASSEASTDGNALASYKTMEEYAASEEVQSQIADTTETLGETGMGLSVRGEGNKFIYTYTMPEGLAGSFSDDLVDSLASSLDSQSGVFESMASLLEIIVAVENPVVVVEYVAADGTVIYSQEFSAPAE